MASVDISSARLVPSPGSQGWLCRCRGAVVWLPEAASPELIEESLSSGGPTELLGRAASRLADPTAPLWPPFAIVASRGADVVVVVHGPVEVAVSQNGTQTRLYGGDEVGSWLNRLVHDCSAVSAGTQAEPEGLVDLREGVVRADGFLLTALGPGEQPGEPDDRVAVLPSQPEASEVQPSSPPGAGAPFSEAESPTVVEQVPVEADLTLAEQAETAVPHGLLGRLTWDTGEVHQLMSPVLIGREVTGDPAVMAGQLVALVPVGQNDSMSRVHAELRPRGRDLVVIDRGSTNGTFIWDEASRAWQRLAPGELYSVPPGGVIAFGERTATFEAVAAHVG